MVANCFLELERSKECLDWIETNKPKIPNEYQALFSGIEIKARKLIKKRELEERKDVKQNDLKVRNLAALAKEIEKRGVMMKPSITGDLDSDLKNLRVPSPGQETMLYFDKDEDCLVWPLLVKFPDLEVADLITDCSENTSLEAILHDVLSFRFESHPIFSATARRVFIELEETNQIRMVDSNSNLGEVLKSPDVIVFNGLPTILVCAMNGDYFRRLKKVDFSLYKLLPQY